MSYRLTVTSKIDIPKQLAKIDNDEFWTHAANEWYRLITPFTPMDTGTLFESVYIRPKKIEYYQPYAAAVYSGTSRSYRKDRHPYASAEWDKAAIPTQQQALINALQKYVETKHK